MKSDFDHLKIITKYTTYQQQGHLCIFLYRNTVQSVLTQELASGMYVSQSLPILCTQDTGTPGEIVKHFFVTM